MRLHSRALRVIPPSRRGTGDLVPAKLLQPWSPVIRAKRGGGVGDLTMGRARFPYNPITGGLSGGVGCARCNQGVGDFSDVATDLAAGSFSSAWTDLQSYMSQLFGTTVGPYVVPAIAAGGVLLLMSAGSKGRRR